MIITRRGFFRSPHISSTECAPTTCVPLASFSIKSSTLETVRLKTATLYPWSFMFSTRFWPITANPINPISQFASDMLALPFCNPARLDKLRPEGEMIPDRGHGSKRRDGTARRLTLRQFLSPGGFLERRRFLISSLAASLLALADGSNSLSFASSAPVRDYSFDRTISRKVLDNFLSRSISMQSLFAGRGNLDDDLRMLTTIGAKFIGRSLCLWGGEANLLNNLETAKQQVPAAVKADPEMMLEPCIFEIVTTQVEQVAVPAWAFAALCRPAEKRTFRYADMLYSD